MLRSDTHWNETAEEEARQRDKFVWELPGGRASDERMLYRIAGWKLPETTPDIAELKDADFGALFLQAAQDGTGDTDIRAADNADIVRLPNSNRLWLRQQAVSGPDLAPTNSILYLTYDAETWYAIVAEFNFVIDAGFVDAESSTAADAEHSLQAVLDPAA
jgi:hypothetical protein